MLKEIILALTRAQVQAQAEQRFDDARRIGRGLTAMLSLDDDAEEKTAPPKTKAGGFVRECSDRGCWDCAVPS